MEQYFAAFFEDIRHERSLILLLSIVEPDILRQIEFRDYEIDIIKNIALEKLYRQLNRKENFALDLLEKQCFDLKMTYLNLKNEPELLKIQTRDDETRNLNYQTEQHNHENILKSLKINNECYKKNIKV